MGADQMDVKEPWTFDSMERYVTANPDNLTIAQLADKLGLLPHEVSKTRKRGLNNGIKPLKPRKPRHDNIDPITVAKIKYDPRDAATVAKANGVSPAVVRRVWREKGRDSSRVVNPDLPVSSPHNVWAVMTDAEREQAVRDSVALTPKQFHGKWWLPTHTHARLRKLAIGDGMSVTTDRHAPFDADRHFQWAKEVARRYEKQVTIQRAWQDAQRARQKEIERTDYSQEPVDDLKK